MGALTGLSGYEAGSKLVPWRGGKESRAQAIVDNPYKPPSAPTAGGPAGQAGAGQQGPNLPPGIKLDVNGRPYDAHTGQKVFKRFFEGRKD